VKRIVKFGIGPRLFVAALLCLGVLGAATILTVRWSVLPDQAAPSRTIETGHGLIDALQTSYKDHGSWAFLPSDAHERRRWIHTLWIQTLNVDNGKSVVTTGTYGDRIGLLGDSCHSRATNAHRTPPAL
jgi:hypothetical protein